MGLDHTSVPVEWGAAAARLKSYGERQYRDDLTTAVVTTDAAAAQDFGFAGALVWGAHELMAAPAGRITAYLAIGSGAPGEGEATALPDLVPVPGFEWPRAAAPDGIPLTHPLLTARDRGRCVVLAADASAVSPGAGGRPVAGGAGDAYGRAGGAAGGLLAS